MKTFKTNTLETKLLELMEVADTVQMSPTIGRIYIQLMMTDKQSAVDKMYNDLKKKLWSLKALELRIKHCLTITIDKKTLIIIALLCEGRIGTMIMYVYYLQYQAKKLNISEITFDVLSSHIFPMGFFTEDTLHLLWDGQKCSSKEYGGSDNIIDYAKAAESIMFDPSNVFKDIV